MHQVKFIVIDVSRALLTLVPFRRDAYVNFLTEIAKGNVDWELLKPPYGLSTACRRWCEAVRDFLAKGCGGK